MKKVELKGLDKTCYVDTLKNGLDIVLIPYEDKNNYYMSYVTRYGSEINTFVPSGEKKYKTVSNGIAHFLEHKMFEQEDGVDPVKYFSESGTGANAFTTFNSTQYICYGTKELEKNLKYLIKYVNEPYFTNENVEKEKGIIKEEIKMYKDIPEWILENKLRESVYNNNPRRIDIAGDLEDIDGITKEELYLCYNTFYNPSNMFLVVVGKFEPNNIMKIIKEQFKDKKEKYEKIKIKDVKETKTVHEEEVELSINLKIPKIGLGYKINKKSLGIKDDLELDMYLHMLSTLLFGISSMFRERVREKHLMTSFYYEWDNIIDYRTLLLYAETENPELLIDEIKTEIKNMKYTKDDLERIKKVWIANEVKMIDFIESTVSNIIDDKIKYNKLVDNKISLIRKINKQKLDEIVSKIDFSNYSKVILLPNKIITNEQTI